MKTKKLIVAYRTRLRPGADKATPEFRAPANYKDQAKIAADVEEKRAAFLADAKNMPYTGTFDEVYIADAEHDGAAQWKHPAEDSGKRPVSVRVRDYLVKHYPGAWADDVVRGRPAVVFIGFDPRTFLKILGLECSLPGLTRAPVGLWYGNADHRDIGEAVMPKEFKGLSLPYVLQQRRPVDPDDAKKWDALVSGWPGPGVRPEDDVAIAITLADQLGFLSE